jgi:SHS2 domain-containing protein
VSLEPAGYEVLSHTADTGIQATADSLGSLIEVLSTGMFELMADCDRTGPSREVSITVEASSVEDLVVDTLSELLYESEIEDLVFCHFHVDVEPETLTARVRASGTPVASAEPVGPPVKAVTYHDLMVNRDSGGWHGRVYFDV